MRNKFLKFALVLALTCIIAGVLTAKPACARGDNIVAIVNDQVITSKDLKEYISNIYSQLRLEGRPPQEIEDIMREYERRGIDQLIEDRLILGFANDKGVDIRPDVIEKKLKEIKDRYPDDAHFLQALDSEGMTVTELKKRLADQMKANYIVETEVRSKVFVNPQEVTQYYNAHLNDLQRKSRVSLDSIFISFMNGKDEARAKAAAARKLLLEGKPFAEVSKQYSELPSVGVLEQGHMLPEVEKVVFAMKEGDVSDVVEVDNGVYVFKLLAKAPGYSPSLREVKDTITGILTNQKFKAKFLDWVGKLRQKAYVEIK